MYVHINLKNHKIGQWVGHRQPVGGITHQFSLNLVRNITVMFLCYIVEMGEIGIQPRILLTPTSQFKIVEQRYVHAVSM